MDDQTNNPTEVTEIAGGESAPRETPRQYRLATLLIVVTALAAFFAWVRTWSSDTQYRFAAGLTIISVVFGLPIGTVVVIRSRFMRARSYFWSVLCSQFVVPILVLYGFFHSQPDEFWTWCSVVLICMVLSVSGVGLVIERFGTPAHSDMMKGGVVGAFWPPVFPFVFGLYPAIAEQSWHSYFYSVYMAYAAAWQLIPLTLFLFGVSAGASYLAIAYREFGDRRLFD